MTAPVLSKTPPPGTPPPTRPAPAQPGPRPQPSHPQPSGPPKVAYRPLSDFTWGHKPEGVSPMQQTFVLISPFTLQPGAVVFFHAAGMREFTPVTVLPRGPLGQFMVEFHGSPLAVAEGKELFEVAS